MNQLRSIDRLPRYQLTVGLNPAIGLVLCLIATGCGTESKTADTTPAPSVGSASLKIERVEPSNTAVNTPFNGRPDGQSAIAVFGTGIPGGSTVLWNDQPLETAGGGTFVAGIVPPKLYENPGTVSITLRSGSGGGISNALVFTIYDKTGPEPKITRLWPESATPGKGFNLQPGGDSAMGIAGEGFLPGVALMFDGKKMVTVFGKGTDLSAVIPAASIAKAGTHEVWAVNPDGKASGKLAFKVAN